MSFMPDEIEVMKQIAANLEKCAAIMGQQIVIKDNKEVLQKDALNNIYRALCLHLTVSDIPIKQSVDILLRLSWDKPEIAKRIEEQYYDIVSYAPINWQKFDEAKQLTEIFRLQVKTKELAEAFRVYAEMAQRDVTTEKPAKTEQGKTETNFSRIDYARIFRRLEKQFENLSQSSKQTKRDIEATTVPAGRSLYSVIRNGFLDSLSPPDWLRSETLLPNLVDEENQPKFGNWKPDEYSLYWIFAMQWLPTANITSVPDYSSLQWAKREWSEDEQKAVRVGFDNEADYIRHIQACGTMYIEACNLIAYVLEGEDNGADNVWLDKTIEQIIIELEAWEEKYLPDNSKNGKIELVDIVTGKLLQKAVGWLEWKKHKIEAKEIKENGTKILKWCNSNKDIYSRPDFSNLDDNPFVANEKGFSLKLTGILRDIVEMARSDSITEKPAGTGLGSKSTLISEEKKTTKSNVSGMSWQEAHKKAEVLVYEKGYLGHKKLYEAIGCSDNTLRKAIKNSSKLQEAKKQYESTSKTLKAVGFTAKVVATYEDSSGSQLSDTETHGILTEMLDRIKRERPEMFEQTKEQLDEMNPDEKRKFAVIYQRDYQNKDKSLSKDGPKTLRQYKQV